MRRLLVPPLAALLLATAACSSGPDGDAQGLGTPSASPQPTTRTATVSPSPGAGVQRPRVVRTVVTGLRVPWGVAFLPDGSALVGERDTTRVLAVPAGARGLRARDLRVVGRLDIATPQGEGGQLGLVASPSYAKDHLVYAYVSTADDNRVVRMTYDGRRLGPPQPVLTGIPNGFIHDGGRLLFDPDGNLFVSTGETGDGQLAQDPSSLGGKILHITPDGRPAPDDPRKGSPVWTMGHRNVQGLAFDDQGRLWATEFGQDTWDELNLIERSRNYGWPLVEGRGDLPEYRNPFVTWNPDDASPSGLAYLDGSLWAGALKGQRLWQVPVTRSGVGDPRAWFVGAYGRLRTVQVAPDGNLWVTTSNRDGRGDPVPGDDRILEIQVPR